MWSKVILLYGDNNLATTQNICVNTLVKIFLTWQFPNFPITEVATVDSLNATQIYSLSDISVQRSCILYL